MVPTDIIRYLDEAGVQYRRWPHGRAVTAQELAASVHVSGRRVAKSVLVEADGAPWIALLPATEIVDRERLASALGVDRVRLMEEGEFAGLFPGCEIGAEPPFGGLYGLPVVVDEDLTREQDLIVRAGSHQEALEIAYDDLAQLERPRLARFGTAARPAAGLMEEGRLI
jgi:Ala-tRNA(Pro) deacylase